VAGGGQLLGDQSVPEFRIIGMDVDRGVDQIGRVEITVAERIAIPGVERLAGEPQYPAGYRHGNALGG
jgi:hypothetical protein